MAKDVVTLYHNPERRYGTRIFIELNVLCRYPSVILYLEQLSRNANVNEAGDKQGYEFAAENVSAVKTYLAGCGFELVEFGTP
jgi:hypothetical protein